MPDSHSSLGLTRTSRRAPGAATFLLLLFGAACSRDAGAAGVSVGFILEGEQGASALRGAELGAEEALHAAELVRRDFALITEEVESAEDVEEAARRLVGEGVVALIGGFDDASCETLSEVADEEDVLFFNVGCRANALRTDQRHRVVHIEASDAMYDSAVMTSGRGALLWHGGLTRFGAAQLNERFNRRFGIPADSEAWAAWMAVKVIWEALSRAPGDTESLLTFIASPATRFDGHKGEALTFEPRTHQLLQPLFPIEPGAPAGEGELSEAQARYMALPLAGDFEFRNVPYLFVTNEGSQDITLVDVAAGEAVARMPVLERPRGIHLDPSGRRLYVALSDDAPRVESDRDAVAAFDVQTGEELGRFPVGSDPEQFGITPDGGRLYASNEDAGTATATEIGSGRIAATVVVGIEPEGVAVSPDGRWVYVTAETSNTVSVIDTRTDAVVASFLVDVRPRGVTFSPGSDRAYVTNEISGSLSVVDTRTHRVIGKIDLGQRARPVGVAVSPDGARVFVATGHGNSVAVIDAATNAIIREVPVGRRPWGITISPDGRFLYTANGTSNDISEVDTSTLTVTRTIPVGERPWGAAYRSAN